MRNDRDSVGVGLSDRGGEGKGIITRQSEQEPRGSLKLGEDLKEEDEYQKHNYSYGSFGRDGS
jgi:hypothetical protein